MSVENVDEEYCVCRDFPDPLDKANTKGKAVKGRAKKTVNASMQVPSTRRTALLESGAVRKVSAELDAAYDREVLKRQQQALTKLDSTMAMVTLMDGMLAFIEMLVCLAEFCFSTAAPPAGAQPQGSKPGIPGAAIKLGPLGDVFKISDLPRRSRRDDRAASEADNPTTSQEPTLPGMAPAEDVSFGTLADTFLSSWGVSIPVRINIAGSYRLATNEMMFCRLMTNLFGPGPFTPWLFHFITYSLYTDLSDFPVYVRSVEGN